MNKDEFQNDPAEEDVGGSSGLGKEAKIGVTVIALLLVGLGVALTYRLMGSSSEENPDTSAIAKTTDAKTPDRPKKDAPKDDASKLFGGIKTKIVPATAASNAVTKPDNSKPDRWSNAFDEKKKYRPSGDASLDPPRPSDSNPHDRYSFDSSAGNRFGKKLPPRNDPLAGNADAGGFATVEAAPPPPVPEESDYDRSSPPRFHRDAPSLKPSAMPIAQHENRGYPRDSQDFRDRDERFRRPPSGSLYKSSLSRRNDGKYEVQPNDSFWTISEKLYGTGAYFKALAKHNRGKDGEDDSLQPGSVIETPELADLEKSYPDLCPKADRREAMQSQQQSRTSTVSTRNQYRSGRSYHVVEGDTLFDIARYELGKASRWAEIYDLNRDVLGKDFNYLAPGTQLVMPDGENNGRKSDIIAEPPNNHWRR